MLYLFCHPSESKELADSSKPTSPSKIKTAVSVQSFPSPDFLSEHVPNGNKSHRPHVTSRVYLSDLFNLAPKVAADMSYERNSVKIKDCWWKVVHTLFLTV